MRVEYELCSPEQPLKSEDVRVFNHLLTLLTKEPIEKSLDELTEVSRKSRLLIARIDGQIVGTATLAVVVAPTGRYGHIDDVVVHDQYRKQGIGQALMEKLIEEAKSLGLERIDLTSRPSRTAAHKLYKRLGFSIYETNVYRRVL